MGYLLEVSDNDRDYLEALVALYLQQTSIELARLEAAISALSPSEVERIAHLCCGSSATCGVLSIIPAFRELGAWARTIGWKMLRDHWRSSKHI
ncbi:MAG: hypothetical protein WKF84_04115 [Pyrinomonadaceae bacterium]